MRASRMLTSQRNPRKDLLEQVTSCSVKKGELRPQKRSRRANNAQQQILQPCLLGGTVNEGEDRHDGFVDLSDDKGDAYQIADEDSNHADTGLEEGAVTFEREPNTREAQQRISDQG